MTAGNRLFSLEGRVALVTGASRGLGLAMAEGLAEVGAIVTLNGRTIDTLEMAASTLQGRGLKAETSPFDVTDIPPHKLPSMPSSNVMDVSTFWSPTQASSIVRRWMIGRQTIGIGF